MSKLFSNELRDWLKTPHRKTVGNLLEVSAEKSFAVLFVVLMAIPALPLPTGGVTHVFEVITILVALQLVAGRSTIWLPKKLRERKLGQTLEKKTIPYLLKKISWLEKHSRPRLSRTLAHRESLRIIGLIVIALTVGAFLAPPFSGLDTIPAIGVVVLSLGLLLEDMVLVIAGVVAGAIGVIIEITLGAAVVELVKRLF
ncbi:MAG: exopolysaccharide biosynthesis protein [Candidatus Saccharimonadales bacterium]